jgi:hypothetical protein
MILSMQTYYQNFKSQGQRMSLNLFTGVVQWFNMGKRTVTAGETTKYDTILEALITNNRENLKRLGEVKTNTDRDALVKLIQEVTAEHTGRLARLDTKKNTLPNLCYMLFHRQKFLALKGELTSTSTALIGALNGLKFAAPPPPPSAEAFGKFNVKKAAEQRKKKDEGGEGETEQTRPRSKSLSAKDNQPAVDMKTLSTVTLKKGAAKPPPPSANPTSANPKRLVQLKPAPAKTSSTSPAEEAAASTDQ